jgi:phage terminase large subunit-like protein
LQDWKRISDTISGGHSWLIEYYKRCKSGDKIIGRELMITLDNLIADMKNPEYRFRLKKPHKRIAFIETNLKHSEAPFANKPFILTLEQKAIAEALFGFEYYDPEHKKWLRRFKEIFLLIGRKNGKTPFVAALTLAEWFCGTMGQKVMCASNDYEQAGLIFDAIDNFRDIAARLERVTRKNNFGIFFGNPKQKKKTGKFSRQNKGTIKKMSARGRAKEGRNLKTVIADEVHEMADGSTIRPLRSSLTTNPESLFFEITTEGTVNEGYLDNRLRLARQVLKGELDRPRWLIWLYTQDSEAEVWTDESTWVKANPMLGVVKQWSELRDLVNDARVSNADRAFTLAKEFNIKSSHPNALFDAKTITLNNGTFALEDFRGAWCVGAADLAETTDLAACTLLFMRPNDQTVYYHTMYFVPRSKADDPLSTESPTNQEKKDYHAWAAAGLCRIVEGNIIDDNVAAEYLWEVFNNYGIRPYRVGYDAWRAKEFAKTVAKRFGDQVPVQISMTTPVLHVPTKQLESDLIDRRVNFNNNDMCRWNFLNTAVRHDNRGQVMPVKLQGYIGNKIDGTMSKVIANATLRQVKAAFMSKVG